ncbi:hypothetical protein An16g05200 [Aspergillus niger]|uniref:Uncharacterized protein n=2 Tax=Aspergillus niger TaxID=5061 RepID=A2R7Y6_ASPNC|nr:hypothetical protein An16g05200 [Aspergillus niger]CAK97374.1 hypothetical protein An16g05200 [Aspergillus niger]
MNKNVEPLDIPRAKARGERPLVAGIDTGCASGWPTAPPLRIFSSSSMEKPVELENGLDVPVPFESEENQSAILE